MRYKSSTTASLKKALETPIAFPAEMAFGLILKASKEPKTVIRNVY